MGLNGLACAVHMEAYKLPWYIRLIFSSLENDWQGIIILRDTKDVQFFTNIVCLSVIYSGRWLD